MHQQTNSISRMLIFLVFWWALLSIFPTATVYSDISHDYPACSLSGDVVIHFVQDYIVANGSEADARLELVNDINIEPGTYAVSLMSYDPAHDPNHPKYTPKDQPQEQWFLQLFANGGLVAHSNSIGDLPLNEVTLTQQVNSALVVSQHVNKAEAFHAAYPINDPEAWNSIWPVCAALTRKHDVIQNGAIGDRVWVDTNQDGRQDENEPGLAGVTVRLFAGSANPDRDRPLRETITGVNGTYIFDNLDPGTYLIQVIPPVGYRFTGSHTCDENYDSDVHGDGCSPPITLKADQEDMTWDAGLITDTWNTCMRFNLELGRDATTGTPMTGTYTLYDAVDGVALASWTAESGWTDSGWIHDIPARQHGTWVRVFFYPYGEDPGVELEIVNPAPGEVFGWLAPDMCHAIEVQFPEGWPGAVAVSEPLVDEAATSSALLSQPAPEVAATTAVPIKFTTGRFELVDVVSGGTIASWEADSWHLESGWSQDIPCRTEGSWVQVYFYPEGQVDGTELEVLNPAPGTTYGWIYPGQDHFIEVQFP